MVVVVEMVKVVVVVVHDGESGAAFLKDHPDGCTRQQQN